MTIQGNEVRLESGAFQQAWDEWHREYEERRAAPYGFLAITSLDFLDVEPRSFRDAPGEWSSTSDGVVLELAEGEEVEVDGVPVTGRHDFGVLPERSGVTVRSGVVEVELAKRGGYDLLRPRHPDNPVRTSYAGTPAFPATSQWLLDAEFAPFDEPRPTTVGAAIDGLEHVYDAIGHLTFSVEGQRFSLLAFPAASDDQLLVLFTDATAGVTTVPSVRSLVVQRGDAEAALETVQLDFNCATNLPCAYTPYATCPLPPAENRLPFEVTAGERNPA